jgi:autotransporter-associated beta strand protein
MRFRGRKKVMPFAATTRENRAAAIRAAEPLESRRLLSAAVWTGAARDGQWFTPGNWQADEVPVAGQDIVLAPDGGGPPPITVSSNVTVGNVDIEDSYTLQGASVTMLGNVTVNAPDASLGDEYEAALQSTIGSLVLGHDTTIDVNYHATLTLQNPTDNGKGFGITQGATSTEGAGSLIIAGTGAAYTGMTEVAAGTLEVDCPLTSHVQVDAGASVSGDGEASGITVEAGGSISFASQSPGDPGPHLSSSTGVTLDAGATLLEGGSSPTGSLDDLGQLAVSSGTIDLAGAAFAALNDSTTLGVGAVITLIANSTGNPIEGTFDNLPEGGMIEDGYATYRISYLGGSSGEDVTLTITAIHSPTAVWTGAAGDGQWSDPANWQSDAVPITGQSVDLPATPAGVTQSILLSQDVQVYILSVEGSYSIQDDTLTVAGFISAEGGAEQTDRISSDLDFPVGVSGIGLGAGDVWTLTGKITGDSDEFGFGDGIGDGRSPAGTLEIEGPTSDLGDIDFGAENLDVENTIGASITMRDMDIVPARLEGDGTVGGIDAQAFNDVSLGQGERAYKLTSTGSVSLATLSELITSSNSAGELVVTGSGSQIGLATVGGGLDVSLAAGVPIPYGKTFTLISNQTGSAVNGIFDVDVPDEAYEALPQGAVFKSNGVRYRISYDGGASGHDVTLTVAPPVVFVSVAHASPNIVSGDSTVLTALGTAASGEGALTYRWSVTASPAGAPRPRFTNNETASASRTVVTFVKAGYYRFRCTISDGNGDTAASDVSVRVEQAAASLRVSPHRAEVAVDKSLTIQAKEYDQFGHPMADQATPTFSIVHGPGTVNATTGQFTATAFGAVLIEAEEDTLTGTVGLQVIP